MPGKFYDDILRSADDRMDFDYLNLPNAWKSRVWTLKAQPKKTIKTQFQQVEETNYDDNHEASIKNKTKSKLEVNHGDCTTTWGFENEKFSFAASGVAHEQDGYKMDLKSKAEYKPKKAEWKAEGELDLRTPDIGGGITAWSRAIAEFKSSGDRKYTLKQNFDVNNEYQLGVHFDHDGKDFTQQYVQAVFQQDGNNFWVRSSLKEMWSGAGCDTQVRDNIRHSFEGVFSWAKDFKGIQGHPVGLRAGVNYDLGDVELHASASWDSNITAAYDLTAQVNKNWTVAVKQFWDSSRVKNASGGYDLGFEATYKL